MGDADDLERPPKKKKLRPMPESEDRPKVTGEDRAMSYGFGIFMLLLGIGMLVGYYFTQRAPSKLFNLLAAGGVACLLSAVGLFVQPLDKQRLDAFRNEPSPIAVFGIMPIFWKIWLLVILAAMIGAFIYVANTTVRVG